MYMNTLRPINIKQGKTANVCIPLLALPNKYSTKTLDSLHKIMSQGILQPPDDL